MRGFGMFHSEHKLRLTAYNQTKMRASRRIVANPEKRPFDTLLGD